jgi:hypothetical protein
MAAPLLFVNKDASNFDSKDYLVAVNSYTQVERFGQQKVDRLKKLRASIHKTHFPWKIRPLRRTGQACSDPLEQTEHQVQIRPRETENKSKSRHRVKCSPRKCSGSAADNLSLSRHRPSEAESGPVRLYSPTGSSIDPFDCSVVPLNVRKHRILQYFTILWMPSSLENTGAVSAFTGLQKQDFQLSFNIIKGFLSSSNEIGTYALLSAAASRMKYMGGLPLDYADTPEFYTMRAVRGVREYLGDGKPITDQVILAIFYLAITELFKKNVSASSAHRQMIKHCIIQLGGLARIEPFISLYCVSLDHIIAASTVTPPVFDFVGVPSLLGIRPQRDAPRSEIKMAVSKRLASLESRVQTIAGDSILLAEVIGYIRLLPEPIPANITRFVQHNMPLVYRHLTLPLRHRSSRGPLTANLQQVMIADGLAVCCRNAAYLLWLWHSALGFVENQSVPTSLKHVTTLMAYYADIMRECLECAEHKLATTAWTLHEDVVLWTTALGVLVAPTAEEVAFYTARFVSVAEKMNIDHVELLRAAFARYIALDRIQGFSLRRFYHLLIAERLETRSYQVT